MPDPHANGAEDYADSLLAKSRTRLAIAKTRIDRAQAELDSAENEWREAYKALNRLEDRHLQSARHTQPEEGR